MFQFSSLLPYTSQLALTNIFQRFNEIIMVKLFGGTVTLGRIRKITFQEDDDKGERVIDLFLLTLFKLVSFIIWVFCAYISLTTWLGQPISCFTDMEEIGTGLLNSYCLIQTREYQW